MSWYENSVIYQIYPLGLTGAPYENDFVSEPNPRLLQLIDHGWIEHMAKLGVTCLILNPVFESSTHGYDTADYRMVDRRLGTMDDLRRVVEACHAQGIRVLLDGVFNHVGRNFWAFLDVKEHRQESPYVDWFEIWWDGDTEWHDGFSYTTWEGVPYLIKLNQSSMSLNNYLAETIRYWEYELGIDGLRLDVAYCLDRGFLSYLRDVANSISEERQDPFVLVGETMFGDYNQWMGDRACHSVTNYEAYKGLWSSMNEANMHEIAYALNRQSGSEPWDLYTGAHLLNFVDNHDVPRIATRLNDKRQLRALYGLLFAMCGVPCVYYGSEWGVEGEQNFGDHEIRPAFEHPEWNDLTDYIAQLAAIRHEGHAGQEALAWGDYRQIAVGPQHLIIQRTSEHERLIVAINASDTAQVFHFDAGCGKAQELITGKEHDFGGGSEVAPFTACYWLCER